MSKQLQNQRTDQLKMINKKTHQQQLINKKNDKLMKEIHLLFEDEQEIEFSNKVRRCIKVTNNKQIYSRIKQYRQRQEQKNISVRHCHAQSINLKERQQRRQQQLKQIDKNAKSILCEKQKNRKQLIQSKKVKMAKLRALSIQAISHIKQVKKIKFEPINDFDVTMKDNKKQLKSKKTEKTEKTEKQPKIDNKIIQKVNENMKMNKTVKKQKNKSKQEELSKNQSTERVQLNKIQNKTRKFYIWNIPIKPQDLQQGKQFMQTRKNNYIAQSLHKKTFKQEANQYIIQKKNLEIKKHIKKSQEEQFLRTIKNRQKQLQQQYDRQNDANNYLQLQNEQIWNQDIHFRHNSMQNFHYPALKI